LNLWACPEGVCLSGDFQFLRGRRHWHPTANTQNERHRCYGKQSWSQNHIGEAYL